jgi:hypothetical protein
MAVTINYQQIYEDQVDQHLKDSLEMTDRFFELSHQQRLLVEQLVDIGYQRALEDALDPSILDDTADLALEMGEQLSSFSGMLRAYIAQQNGDED